MLVHNPSNTPVKGFNWAGMLYNVGVGETVEVSNDIGVRLISNFGFLVEAKEVEEVKVEEMVEEELPTNFMQLKKYAKEKGVEVTQEMTKDEVMEELNKLNS